MVSYTTDPELQMANIRDLLRSERVSRRIVHPHAIYSSSGQLLCAACRTSVKSDTLWDAHLSSSQHASGLAQAKQRSLTDREPANKRKIDNDQVSASKRPRADYASGVNSADRVLPDTPNTRMDHETSGDDAPALVIEQPTSVDEITVSAISRGATGENGSAVDEDEWAAFEKEIATPPPESKLSAFTAPASILAQPVGASELETRPSGVPLAGKDQQTGAEAEQEEASRQLEEEFEEMEALEQRVRKLKDQREALRSARARPSTTITNAVDNSLPTDLPRPSDFSSDEDSTDNEDGFDAWHVKRIKFNKA